jgi:maltooligosyltrehalose trehalohydrolase
MRIPREPCALTPVGALPDKNGGTFFCVWAPFANQVLVNIVDKKRLVPLKMDERGYFAAELEGVKDKDIYRYVVDGHELPDPASRYQPEGVHGPSQVVDHSLFQWEDSAWRGIPAAHYVIYELHVGTFTREGTFEAVMQCLDYIKELGVTAIEIMPVCQFPGERNWGYDGTYPFAPQNSYGGPTGLKSLVNACHTEGLAVILDVVYNHLGPEGNYVNRFGPYFTDRYRTPWGDAMNFDGPLSDEVRNFFIQNALEFIRDYHIDALRLDAIHGIYDFSARTFLEDLVESVENECGGGIGPYLMAECDLNNIQIVTPRECGGQGFHAQWNDDFHHALHTLLTGEKAGYYEDFGTLAHLAKTAGEGYVFTGQFSKYRRKKHGSPSKHMSCRQFIVFSQNHDQIGNRALGERLANLVSHDKLRLAAAMVLMSPSIPLLFMGEEYGETAPFLYFVSHGDEELVEAVRLGRALEFVSFHGHFIVPDPQSPETFERSRVNRDLRRIRPHSGLYAFYRHLLELRKSVMPWDLKENWPHVESWPEKTALCIILDPSAGDIACLFNFGTEIVSLSPGLPDGTWVKLSDTSSPRWGGDGEIAPSRSHTGDAGIPLGPLNAVIYRKEI